MKWLGLIIFLLGLFFLYNGLTMDTSVATVGGDRVHNLAAASNRLSVLIIAGFTSLGGLGLIAAGEISDRLKK